MSHVPGPGFFIVGAPKCGTTTLASWLSEHPEVFLSVPKEPHYFNEDMANRNVTNDDAYRALFKHAGPQHRAVGEASTWYMFSKVAVPNIEAACAEPRYIAMTRDPVEMAQSLYLHNLRHLHEDAPTFDCGWELQEARRLGKAIPATCREPRFLQYRAACSLGEQLRRLLTQVPPERVLHIDLDDLRTSPHVEYLRVLTFLGLEDDGKRSFAPANEARLPRSRALQRLLMTGGRLRRAVGLRRGFGLMRLNERRVTKPTMSPDFRAALIEAFRADREELDRLAGSLRR